jgi:hypothetical protein
LRVLLLHPDDTPSRIFPGQRCDLIIDFAHAPNSTYDRWRRETGCPLLSLYHFAQEVDDLGVVRRLLQLGTGRVLDHWGIDWWDVLSLEIAPQIQQLMLVRRLSEELGASCELYASRPHPLATALQRLLGVRLTILESRFQSVVHRARHYRDAFSHLDTAQLAQVLEDKFDGDHSVRRRFTRRGYTSGKPVILLPSAYINVSRAALEYAKLIPDHQFLLVHTRSSAKLASPANVRSVSLTPYFVPGDKQETASLLESWNGLRKHLVSNAEEFKMAEAVGVLAKIPSLLHWGLALRNAWSQIFESENVTACLCADDSNPPSSIPLIMAKQRGLPALACHHGALNYHMAIKTNHADVYLVKNEMERDYLQRICNVASEKIVIAALSSRPLPMQHVALRSASWLVFFTEPYQSSGWRSDEVYRDLLPRLCALAQTCGLRLVFKLHPFDSIKGHRKMLHRFVPEHERQIKVLAGPTPDELWKNTRLALTVQSSTALQCAALGIPVFLCGWLRDPYSGYVQQYARFGVGHVLESPEQLADVPQLLETHKITCRQREVPEESADSSRLARLFSAGHTLTAAATHETFSKQVTVAEAFEF